MNASNKELRALLEESQMLLANDINCNSYTWHTTFRREAKGDGTYLTPLTREALSALCAMMSKDAGAKKDGAKDGKDDKADGKKPRPVTRKELTDFLSVHGQGRSKFNVLMRQMGEARRATFLSLLFFFSFPIFLVFFFFFSYLLFSL